VTAPIAVVVAAYNVAGYVGETLASLKRQTFHGFEAVIVDDGSQDATPEEIAAAIAHDSRFRCVSTANRGVSAARNLGLAEIQSPLVVFLDADDLLRADALERFVAHMATSAAPAAFGAHLKFADAPPPEDAAPSRARAAPAGDTLGALLARNFIANGGALCIRTDVARTVGGFREDLRFAEDWEFWCRLALHGDFDPIPGFAPLLYRQRAGGANMRLSGAAIAGRSHPAVEAAFSHPDIVARFPAHRLKRLRRAFARNGFWSSARLALTHGEAARFLGYAALGLVRYPESVLQPRLAYLFLRSVARRGRG